MCNHSDNPLTAAACTEGGGGHEACTVVETTTARSNMEKTYNSFINEFINLAYF